MGGYAITGGGAGTFTTLSGTTNVVAASDITITSGSIISASGAITFGNENLSTTGTLGAGAVTGTSFIIGANTLTTSEWAYLDGQNQAVATTSSPTFVNLTITSFAANWTNAGRTVADAGILTTVDINGGTIDGVTIGGAAAGAISATTITASGAYIALGSNYTASGNDQDFWMGSAGNTFLRVDTKSSSGAVTITSGNRASGATSLSLQTAIGGTEADRLVFDTSGNANFSGILSVDDTTDSSSTVTGSIHTDGGLGVAKKSYFGKAVNVTLASPDTGVISTFRNEDATNGYGVVIESEGATATRYALMLRNLAGSTIYGGVSTATGQVGYWAIGGSPGGTVPSRLSVSNGDIQAVDGNVIIGTSGKGIDFSATADASGMTSELLDDYETGTWTPVITFSAGSGTITYTTQQGTYTKIGNLVTIRGRLTTSSIASRTGSATLGGAPYTVGATYFGPITVGYAGGLAITAGYSVCALLSPSGVVAPIYLWDATTGPTAIQNTEWTDDGDIIFGGQYNV